jgi:hypothetical protein
MLAMSPIAQRILTSQEGRFSMELDRFELPLTDTRNTPKSGSFRREQRPRNTTKKTEQNVKWKQVCLKLKV